MTGHIGREGIIQRLQRWPERKTLPVNHCERHFLPGAQVFHQDTLHLPPSPKHRDLHLEVVIRDTKGLPPTDLVILKQFRNSLHNEATLAPPGSSLQGKQIHYFICIQQADEPIIREAIQLAKENLFLNLVINDTTLSLGGIQVGLSSLARISADDRPTLEFFLAGQRSRHNH